MPPRILADRYRLDAPIGRGAHGEVWAAHDLVLGEPVAVKLLLQGLADPARVRREISTLRLLRIPGVAHLLDEGIEGDCPFLVMERVDGAPFPGPRATPPCAWAPIAARVAAVLETLSQIHAAGVVHRDLKPENVLVGPGDRTTILDFGLSVRGPASAGAAGDEGDDEYIGTPLYLAPEQIRGEPVSAQTDLYALGIMLYEALAGQPPHEGRNVGELYGARLTLQPRPLREIAPQVPPEVADAVDRLLEIEPDHRPRSALEALQALRGGAAERGPERALPRLGGDLPLCRVIEAARQGRSIDVVGPPGSGRSRCLNDAAEALDLEGIRVIRLDPTPDPLATLAPVIGDLHEYADAPLEEVLREVDRRVAAALAGGAALLVDDADAIDALSGAALERARAGGCVIRALLPAAAGAARAPDAELVELEPLGEDALLQLFSGRERVFHLRTDAARALRARTGGQPARIHEELASWERAGLCRWTGEAFAIDREALDSLDAGLALPLGVGAGAADATPGRLTAPHQDLLRWIELSYPDAQAELLARAAQEPRWRVEAEAEELLRRGVIARLDDGRLWPRRPPPEPWPAERRRAAHRAFAAALPPAAERRMLHLVRAYEGRADDALEIAREAARLAARQAAEGRLGQAVAALSEGLTVLRRHADAGDPQGSEAALVLSSLLASWVEIALLEGTPQALDRVLHEICRSKVRAHGVAPLEALVRAALALAAGSERALAMAEAVPAFDDPGLERGRQDLRVVAARRMSPERLEAVIAGAEAWADRAGGAAPRAALRGWLGRLRYQQGRFEESATLHAAATEGEPWAIARAVAMFQAASAWMEAFRFDECAEVAERARDLAASCRNALCEAKAEWLLRAVAYRRSDALAADPELVDAVAAVGVPDLEALACVTEAAVLFRAGDREGAARLAEQAYRLWSPMGKRWPALVSRALSLAAVPAAPVEEAHAMVERARGCPVPGMGIQVLGLLAMGYPEARAAWASFAPPLVAEIPAEVRGLRMDVLSADECLTALGAQGP